MQLVFRSGLCSIIILLGACSPEDDTSATKAPTAHQQEEKSKVHGQAKQEEDKQESKNETADKSEENEEKSDFVVLSDKQIKAGGFEVMPMRQSFAGAIEASAVIVADPKHAAVIASSVAGRVVEIRRNLGEAVTRGEVLAVIESRDLAQLKAEVEIAKRQSELAQAIFKREERLYGEKVSSRQEFEVAKAGAQETKTRMQLAEQQLAAAGGSPDGQLNRLLLRSPIKGHVTARQIALGDVVEPNAHLFDIANLGELSVELSLSPEDASRVAIGAVVTVSTDGRTGTGKISYVSRVLDPATRQVRAIARLTNKGGNWRIGETVRASIELVTDDSRGQLAIPATAVQTIKGQPSVFVRVKGGFAIKHLVLGAAAAGYVKVQSGLEGNEQIAVSNTYVLKAEQGKGEAGDDD